MINIFEIINNVVKSNFNNQQYGDIGKPITEDKKKQLLNLLDEECEIYENIKMCDKNRLNGIYNQQLITQLQQAENDNSMNKLIQIL